VNMIQYLIAKDICQVIFKNFFGTVFIVGHSYRLLAFRSLL
jgi:hypothetical protein